MCKQWVPISAQIKSLFIELCFQIWALEKRKDEQCNRNCPSGEWAAISISSEELKPNWTIILQAYQTHISRQDNTAGIDVGFTIRVYLMYRCTTRLVCTNIHIIKGVIRDNALTYGYNLSISEVSCHEMIRPFKAVSQLSGMVWWSL